MLTTQQFADLCDTSKRTIHYYDEIGLLKPQKLRGKQRLYTPSQVLVYQKIAFLKLMGLNLEDIKKQLHNNEFFKQFLKDREKELKAEMQKLQFNLNRIKEYQENLKKMNFIIQPQVKEMKSYILYAIKRQGRYVDIASYVRELAALINDKSFSLTYVTLFDEPYYSPHNSSMTIGAIVKTKKIVQLKGVELIKVNGYKALVYKHIGPYSYLSYIWKVLEKYAKNNNLHVNKNIPDCEFYLPVTQEEMKQENFVTEIHLPLM
jgi:DNA-binding transcriptional MerR regulator